MPGGKSQLNLSPRFRSKGVQAMGSIHVPRLTGRRRAGGPRLGRTGRLGLAVAVAAAMTLAAGAHYAASAAADAPFGGTAAALPGTVYAANYDTGGQGVA